MDSERPKAHLRNARGAKICLSYGVRNGQYGIKSQLQRQQELGRKSVRYSMGFCLMSNMVAPGFCLFVENAWAIRNACFRYLSQRLL